MGTTFKSGLRIVRRPSTILATALLIGLSGPAWARGAGSDSGFPTFGSQAPTAGQSFVTSRGPAFVTGHFGSMETTTLPGSGGQGLLTNNGNGTSTLIVPGGAPQVVATPR
jgi:hypothetical protein